MHENKRDKIRMPKTNDFIERFNRTILDEFFWIIFREKYFESVESLQDEMDIWITHYNTERTHQDYRNNGRRPIDTISSYLEPVIQEA